MRLASVVLIAAVLILTGCDRTDDESDPDAQDTTSVAPTTSTTTTTLQPTTTLVRLFPEIAWSMPARFGLDGNNDGRIDVPNTADYAHNLPAGSCVPGCPVAAPTFTVLLSGAGSRTDVGPINEYRWEVRAGSEVVAAATSSAAEAEVPLTEGNYLVSLTVSAGGQLATATEEIAVEDHLIVAIGDSYASGEGNPEANTIDNSGPITRVIGIWADDGVGGPVADHHRRAHRSTLAATPQAALALEAASNHSSVTLLHFPSSGATIARGLMGSNPGVPYEQVSETRLPPQIDALAAVLGCVATAEGARCDRPIDALTISIGGNDMGFGIVWGGLVLADPSLSLGGSYDFAVGEIFLIAEAGIRGLAAEYAALEEAIRTRLEVEQIYLIAYPSPVGSGESLCDEVADDLVRGLEADREEILQAVDRVLEPLGRAMAAAAATHGWVYVDSHVDDFAPHGYCRNAPYPAAAYPGNPFPLDVQPPTDPQARWFRTAEESTDIQGVPDSSSFRPADLATRGTLHPNEYGHQSIRDALLAVLDLG